MSFIHQLKKKKKCPRVVQFIIDLLQRDVKHTFLKRMESIFYQKHDKNIKKWCSFSKIKVDGYFSIKETTSS